MLKGAKNLCQNYLSLFISADSHYFLTDCLFLLLFLLDFGQILLQNRFEIALEIGFSLEISKSELDFERGHDYFVKLLEFQKRGQRAGYYDENLDFWVVSESHFCDVV